MAAKKEAETVRLRNINSGAVVSVASEKVARMGSEWEPAGSTRSSTAEKPAASSAKK